MIVVDDPVTDPLDHLRLAFLNALDDGDGIAEAAAYLDAGGQIDAPIVPMIDQTMLHYAAINRHAALIELLAERGADLDVENAFGMSALHLAVTHEIDAVLLQWQEPDFPIARRLVQLGASLDSMDNQGKRPRDVAAIYGPAMLGLFDEVVK